MRRAFVRDGAGAERSARATHTDAQRVGQDGRRAEVGVGPRQAGRPSGVLPDSTGPRDRTLHSI